MNWIKKYGIFFLLLAFALDSNAHVIKYELERLDDKDVVLKYLQLGFTHIIPLGFDHVLFILCVFFLNADIKKIILQATMFTLAHSITLGMAAYGLIEPPGNIVEPLIAISIVFLALENIFSDKVKPWRMAMVFLFGLIHGMGFAGALAEMGLPRYAFWQALISFNVGVELGQLTIIVVMYFVVAKLFGTKPWYRQRIVIPASVLIALVAGYWTIERIFFTAAA
ncbi:MAG: HupE/UreJ family protein [Chitinophagales bacterium]|nr:HupE/UreJ family protein [Chitinophagales bacterium]